MEEELANLGLKTKQMKAQAEQRKLTGAHGGGRL